MKHLLTLTLALALGAPLYASNTNLFLSTSGTSRKPKLLQITLEQLAKVIEDKDTATLEIYATIPAAYLFTDLQKSEQLVKTALQTKTTSTPTATPDIPDVTNSTNITSKKLTRDELQNRNASSIDKLLTAETLLERCHIKANPQQVAAYTKRLQKMDIDQLFAELNQLATEQEDVITIANDVYRLSNLDTEQARKAYRQDPTPANRKAIFQILKNITQQLKPEILQRLRNLAIKLNFKKLTENKEYQHKQTEINPTIKDVQDRMPAPFNKVPINSKEFEQQVAYINSLDRQGLIQEFKKRATTDAKRLMINTFWWRCAGDRSYPSQGNILMDLHTAKTEEAKEKYRKELDAYIASQIPTAPDGIIRGLRLRLVGMHFIQDDITETKNQTTKVDHHAKTETTATLDWIIKHIYQNENITNYKITPEAFEAYKAKINTMNAQELVQEFKNIANTDPKRYVLDHTWRAFDNTPLLILDSSTKTNEEKIQARQNLISYLEQKVPEIYNQDDANHQRIIQNLREKLIAIKFMQ